MINRYEWGGDQYILLAWRSIDMIGVQINIYDWGGDQ
jgi:hypothetical protein